MIVEMRSYTFHPGKASEYLKIVESDALALQTEYLGAPVGFYSSDVGPQEQVIHMWAYEDHADRERRRNELAKVPEWKAFQQKPPPLIQSYETRILVPAPFFVPKR